MLFFLTNLLLFGVFVAVAVAVVVPKAPYCVMRVACYSSNSERKIRDNWQSNMSNIIFLGGAKFIRKQDTTTEEKL